MKNIEELKKYLDYPIVGISVQAFGRTGIEDVFSNFSIACLSFSGEIKYLREAGVSVFCLEEFLKKHPGGKKNPTTLLLNKTAQDFIKKRSFSKKPVLFLYKNSTKIEALAQKHGWIIAANPTRMREALENKRCFRKILKKLKIDGVPGEVVPLKKINYARQSAKYPNGFVVQDPKQGGGAGTCFIKTKKDLEKCFARLVSKLRIPLSSGVLISQFIKGYSPSVTACVTNKGIFKLPPQLQLIDLKELYPQAKGNGVFCGTDWSASRKIPQPIRIKMNATIEKIGVFLKRRGFKGIFGVDFIVDEISEEVFPIELNPRLLGVFPVSTFVQKKQKEIPLIIFHILAFLNADCVLEAATYNSEVVKEKEGAHFFITAPFRPYQVTGTVTPGIHKIRSGKLKYVRPGYKLEDLSNSQEFLLVDGVPQKGKQVLKNTGLLRILRVVTSCKISQDMGRELNPFGKKIAKAIYKTLGIIRPK